MNKTILMDNEHAYDEWAAAYDLAENQTRDMEIKVAQQILGTKQYSQVIELGCGTGKNTIWLSKLTSCLIGIDFSREMLKIARQKVKDAHVTFVHGNLLKPWNFGNKAELITSSLVLEHIDNLDYIFREIAEHLTPNVRFYMCELHPYKQYNGSKARYKYDGVTKELQCFTHHISDYFTVANKYNLKCIQLNEWPDDDNNSNSKIPRLISMIFEK